MCPACVAAAAALAIRSAGHDCDHGRVRGGERHVQDGPFADTKEQLGGFILFELPSLDEAIKWAAKCPAAQYGAVEVRPVADLTHIFGPMHGRGT